MTTQCKYDSDDRVEDTRGLHSVREQGTVNNSYAGGERKCQEMRLIGKQGPDQEGPQI